MFSWFCDTVLVVLTAFEVRRKVCVAPLGLRAHSEPASRCWAFCWLLPAAAEAKVEGAIVLDGGG